MKTKQIEIQQQSKKRWKCTYKINPKYGSNLSKQKNFIYNKIGHNKPNNNKEAKKDEIILMKSIKNMF